MNNPTSLKQAFQSMIPTNGEIIQGTVTKDDPIEITATNDAKLIISGEELIVPWHLTDYITHVDLTMGDKGTFKDETYTKVDGGHTHVDSRGGTTTETKHKHWLDQYNAYSMKLKVYNHLRKGDIVHILVLNNGKLYYVLDRVSGQEI